MKFHTIELEGREVEFRLTSQACVEIEKKNNMSIQDYIRQASNTTCINLLRYMRKASNPGFSEKDAYDLYDKLVDNDYTMESIYMDIILPTCVVSGLLTQSNLDELREAMNDPEKIQAMQESANK